VARLEWCARVRDEEWLELRAVLWLPRDAVAGTAMEKRRRMTPAMNLDLKIVISFGYCALSVWRPPLTEPRNNSDPGATFRVSLRELPLTIALICASTSR
jgi:hypothetical protein